MLEFGRIWAGTRLMPMARVRCTAWGGVFGRDSSGEKFPCAAVREEQLTLQVVGAINAHTARLAEAAGFKAVYLSGGGVAANSLGVPDLGISSMEDVLTDVRRITRRDGVALAC